MAGSYNCAEDWNFGLGSTHPGVVRRYNFFLPGSYNIRCRRLELRPGSTLLQLAGGSRPRKADRPLGTRVLKAP